jgi:hypothetical protein
MTLLQEATLDRLWAKYEHRFGHPPPIGSADIEDAIALIRKELAAPAPQAAVSHALTGPHGLAEIDVTWPYRWH